jgi:AraC-like DNA-binding protein
MIFKMHQPSPPLAEWVEFFWFYEGLTPSHARERVLPDGTFELLINLKDEPRHVFDGKTLRPTQSYRHGWLSGTHSRYIVIDTAPNSSMMGVHFKPGGAARFLRQPASEFTEQVIELDQIWGQAGWDLRDALLETRGVAAKFYVLHQFLLQRLRPLRRLCEATGHAVRQLTTEPSVVSLQGIARAAGLSHKQFIERFRAEVGMTPKRFCRIRRFHQTLQQTTGVPRIDWAEVACASGYYDQAHLIHDFQSFAGLTPSAYLAQKEVGANFVPLPE